MKTYQFKNSSKVAKKCFQITVLLALLMFPTTMFAQGDPCQTPSSYFEFTSEVPHDVNSTSERLPQTETCLQALAYFSWKQFLALSWQSSYSEDIPIRGEPADPETWNYSMPYTNHLVWETYAHRSELRPAGLPLNTPFNKPPKYIYVNQPLPGEGSPRFNLFNNLDEDNEIGSADVYHGAGSLSQELVVYQAKVNRAEYDYVKTNFGPGQADPTGLLSIAAKNNQFKIEEQQPVTSATPHIYLPAGNYQTEGDSYQAEGAIEIKTAFLRVTPENKTMLEGFFQTEAIYYTATYDEATETYSNYRYHNGTFALLGMHIIHKTKAYPDFIFTSFEHKALADMDFQYRLLSPLPPLYGNFNPHNAPSGVQPEGTQIGKRIPVVRQLSTPTPTSNGQLYPVPPYLDVVTKEVHKQLRGFNKNSVWLNYRLIGVQANITEGWSSTPGTKKVPVVEGTGERTIQVGPNHFMANHVIESDAFLGNFFGPGFGRNPFPTGDDGNGANVFYKGSTYNMGGCKGCHGVAQTSSGTDFSFLLDFGKGKPVVNPDTIIYHPDTP